MSVSLKIPEAVSIEKRSIALPNTIWARFDQYIRAAQISAPHATESMVLEALLDDHFRKDKAFCAWVKQHPNGTGASAKRRESTS